MNHPVVVHVVHNILFLAPVRSATEAFGARHRGQPGHHLPVPRTAVPPLGRRQHDRRGLPHLHGVLRLVVHQGEGRPRGLLQPSARICRQRVIRAARPGGCSKKEITNPFSQKRVNFIWEETTQKSASSSRSVNTFCGMSFPEATLFGEEYMYSVQPPASDLHRVVHLITNNLLLTL